MVKNVSKIGGMSKINKYTYFKNSKIQKSKNSKLIKEIKTVQEVVKKHIHKNWVSHVV